MAGLQSSQSCTNRDVYLLRKDYDLEVPTASHYLCWRAASLEAVEGPRGCHTIVLEIPLGQQTYVAHLAQHCRSTIKGEDALLYR